jgi:hypothetical protein
MGTLRKLLSFMPFIDATVAMSDKIVIDAISEEKEKPKFQRSKNKDKSKGIKMSKTAFQKRKIKRTIQEHSRVMNRKNQ